MTDADRRYGILFDAVAGITLTSDDRQLLQRLADTDVETVDRLANLIRAARDTGPVHHPAAAGSLTAALAGVWLDEADDQLLDGLDRHADDDGTLPHSRLADLIVRVRGVQPDPPAPPPPPARPKVRQQPPDQLHHRRRRHHRHHPA